MVAVIQGVYFIATGLWPIINISSFEKVSGPKIDKWLVKTFGALVASIGLVLLLSNPENEVTKSVGIVSAIALGLADTYYSLRKIIPKIYLLDASIEFLFVILWIYFK
jgi:hypothetical protein